MTKIYSNLGEIEIKFPEKLFQSYIKKIENKGSQRLGYSEINKILVLAFEDFMVGRCSIDDISEICEYLHCKLDKIDHSDLEKVLDYGSELSFYIRNVQTENDNYVSRSIVMLKKYVETVKSYLYK